MSSTNKTTNYELSQFVGSDKPTWLGDYNSDMSKIDAQMKNNANAVQTAQSTADTASSTANSAQSTANTASSTATTASETATSALNKSLANESAIANFNLTNFTEYDKNDFTINNNSFVFSNTDTTKITVARNSDGSLCKIYGNIYGQADATNVVDITIQTDLRPTSNITISPDCIVFLWSSNIVSNKACTVGSIQIETDGKIRFRIGLVGGQYIRIVALPYLLFIKDFGDLPE